MIPSGTSIPRKPDWLKIKLPRGFKSSQVVGLLNEYGLHTICSSGMCPNKGECWGRGTATFMIGGNICTRNCKFCNVASGKPLPPDEKEIENICLAIGKLNLKHVVLTSVDRDDLPDFGAVHWARTIRQIKEQYPNVTIETLIPDFQGDEELIELVIKEKPEVISHNLETVRRLTPEVRSVATYEGSLKVLSYLSSRNVKSKTGIMLGLGETEDEVISTMDDVLATGCRIITIGQYLQPSLKHYPLKEYIRPEVFEKYRQIGIEKGFRHIESSPFVRSSFHAEKHIN